MDLAFEAIYQPLSSIDMYFKKAHKASRSLFSWGTTAIMFEKVRTVWFDLCPITSVFNTHNP